MSERGFAIAFFAAPFVLWSFAGTAAADTLEAARAVPSMKLRDALAYAHSHQPQIIAARARIDAARADARIPRAQWLPSVGAAAELVIGTTNNTTATPIGTGVLDLARIGGTKVTTSPSLKPAPTTLVGIGAAQEIFDFGRIAAQSAAFDAGVVVERRQAEVTDLDVSFAVESAYFAVQAAKAVVTAAEGAYTRALAHRDLAKAGVASGMRPPLELTRAEADLARFDVGRIRARGGLTAARAELAAAIGSDEAAVDAADDPATAPANAPSLDELHKEAPARDPLVLAAEARLKQQELTTRAIRAEMRPNVWLTTTFTGRAGGADPSSGDVPASKGWAPVIPNWDVGLVFSWRAFDGTIQARADSSHAREAVRRAELDNVRQVERSALDRAVVAADLAKTSLGALERSREAAQANYAQVDARFKAGLATSVELADAEAIRTQAEIEEAIGKYEAARTRAALGRASGKDAWNATP